MTVLYVDKKIELDEKLRAIRTERYALQSVSRKALPQERIAMCLRKVNGSNVEIWKHRKTNKAFYNGLWICGSVWTCPVCAAKISEIRKKELEQAFEIHKQQGGKIAHLILTFSHKKTDKLSTILNLFGQATKKFMSGKSYQKIRDQLGLIGRIRVTEVTYGKNGFHPHLHIALFYTNDIDDLKPIRNQMYQLWKSACEKYGLKTTDKHGLKLQDGEDAQSYLSKHGTWSLEQELSKSHIKKAKSEEGLSPFDFLREYLKAEDIKYLLLFREYADCFKGKRQIQWSQGLKKRFMVADKTDEEVAKEKTEEADVLGMLTYEDWQHILKTEQRAQFLNRVERLGFYDAYNLTIKKESSVAEDSQVKTNIK